MNFQWQEVIWGGLLFAAVLMLFLALGFYKSELDDASAHQDGSLVKTDKLLALPVASQIFAAPIAWVSMRINSFMSAGLTSKLNAKLVAAGLDGSLSALSFVAMKTLVFLIVSAILLLILLSRDDALGVQGLLVSGAIAGASFWLPDSWLRDVGIARRNRILKALPFFIDLLKIAIDAGSNMQGALQYAVMYGPPGPLRNEFSKVLGDIRSGKSRAQALQDFSQRNCIVAISHLCSAIISAEKQGASLGGILQAQAEQRRQERFSAAETAAMKAPVKMLAPLVIFIFPGTFIILFFPVVVRLFQEGLIR